MILKNKRTYSKEDKIVLWERYREDPDDLKNFNELLEAYLPLVEVIASKAKSSLPTFIEIGDLVNDAFFGLVDAVQKFDPSKGFKFETYASTRIKGAVTDCLRDYDSTSRYSRLKFKEISQTIAILQEEYQREPTQQELADRIGWDLDELYKVQAAYRNSYSVNIDEYMIGSSHEAFSLQEVLADDKEDDFADSIELQKLRETLQGALFKLDEQESIIVYLHLYEMKKFKDIAELLDINSNKVASLYDQAILKLQEILMPK